MREEAGCATTKGPRSVNADAYLIDDAASFYAVADAAGDSPSSSAVARLALAEVMGAFTALRWAEIKHEGRWPYAAASSLRTGLEVANQRIRSEGSERSTTFTGAVICGDRGLCIASVGHSRAYLFRPSTRRIAQLTHDHTMFAGYLRHGLPYEVAKAQPRARALTRSLGVWPDARSDIAVTDWEPNDVLLLCTNGVTDCLDTATISQNLLETSDPTIAAARLVDQARDKGSADNATAVVVRRIS